MRTLASIAAILVALALRLAATGTPGARVAVAQENIPLLADGSVNLGSLPGEKGVWELTYIENMANYMIAAPGRGGGGRGARGSAGEPQVPFMIDDPGAYTRPWTVAWNIKWWPDGQLDEYVCEENNKYIQTLKDDFGMPIFFTK